MGWRRVFRNWWADAGVFQTTGDCHTHFYSDCSLASKFQNVFILQGSTLNTTLSKTFIDLHSAKSEHFSFLCSLLCFSFCLILLLLFFKFYLFTSGCIGSLLLFAGFSLVAVSRGYPSLRCMGFSLRWLLLLRSLGSRHVGFSSCGTRAQ